MEHVQCQRGRCENLAQYYRWKTDTNKRGANLNEPGMTQEFVCVAHANELRDYIGARLFHVDTDKEESLEEVMRHKRAVDAAQKKRDDDFIRRCTELVDDVVVDFTRTVTTPPTGKPNV